MGPGDLYILGIGLTALFVAPFNALARVVVLSWLAVRLLWMTGLPEPLANVGAAVLIICLGWRHIHHREARLSVFATAAWSISLAQFVINAAWLIGVVAPHHGWWGALIGGLLQLALLPFSTSKEVQIAVFKAWRSTESAGLFRVRWGEA